MRNSTHKHYHKHIGSSIYPRRRNEETLRHGKGVEAKAPLCHVYFQPDRINVVSTSL